MMFKYFRFLTGLLLAAGAWPAFGQTQAILDNEVREPRTFGYVIGDRIRREVRLVVREDYRLDDTSLPDAGRLSLWLEAAAPAVRNVQAEDRREYRLIFEYQIVNVPFQLGPIAIPQHDLRVVGPAGAPALTTLVPALEVTVSPITADGPSSGRSLQADRPPAPIPTETLRLRLAGSGAVLLGLLLLAAARRGISVFVARRKLPFASAARKLRRLRSGLAAPARDAAALRIVHAAINETAGRAVFAHDLGEFLRTHPRFAGFRTDFDRVFAASSRIFFDGRQEVSGESVWPVLVRLCRSCSRIEWRMFRDRLDGVRP